MASKLIKIGSILLISYGGIWLSINLTWLYLISRVGDIASREQAVTNITGYAILTLLGVFVLLINRHWRQTHKQTDYKRMIDVSTDKIVRGVK